jgi:hypothetical protein
MKVELIKKDAAINFADCYPQRKEIILDAIEHIYTYENVMQGDPEDFEVSYGSDETTNTFGGAFFTSIYGSYLLHDLRVEEVVCDEETQFECTIAFYSLSKISDDDKS